MEIERVTDMRCEGVAAAGAARTGHVSRDAPSRVWSAGSTATRVPRTGTPLPNATGVPTLTRT
jgi:hypothetical protein